jgi:UDP-N-acetylmuramate dehydrogenase
VPRGRESRFPGGLTVDTSLRARLSDELAALVARVRASEPLARHSTFGIGGPADFYVEVETESQIQKLVVWARDHHLPVFPIGQGSNLLIADKGIRGVVVRLRGEFENIHAEDGDTLAAGAGVTWPRLALHCAHRGLAGAEGLVGIPGTLGGGLMTNAGTPEGDTGALVQEVRILTPEGRPEVLTRQDLHFSYRHSNLPGKLVLDVRLKLRRENKNDIMGRLRKQLSRRAQTQPLGTQNVGSIFKNPPGDYAARLLEAAGLKGFQIGGAQVSPRHANFIVNTGHATAQDVHRLIEAARRAVQEKFGVRLDLEVWPVGDS